MASTALETYRAYCTQWEAQIGAFIAMKAIAPDRAFPVVTPEASQGNGLAGLPFAVKDNIAVQDLSLSCGSKLLEELRAPYTATAVRKLEAAGAWVLGKTNLDEFGMGSSTDNSAIKQTNNPWDTNRVAGGSSGGSAAAVAAGMVPFALGSDTGGSVRQPASFCGVLGLKPSYGAVSRYGLVAYASSLESIGILADTTARCRSVFSVIRGKDPLDQTSQDVPAAAAPLYGTDPLGAPQVIGVLSAQAIAKALAAVAAGIEGSPETQETAAAAALLEEAVQQGFELAKTRLAALGHRLVDVEIPSLKYGVPAYYTIATAEASANLARFDGVRYGRRPHWAENPDDLIDKTREAGFGPEVKLRILLGTFVLRSGFQDRYYLRAQRIRSRIRRSFEELLGSADYGNSPPPYCDAILMPVFPTRAFGRGDTGETLSPFAQKAADLYTCCANLAGLPALAFPVGLSGGLPVGVQLLGRAFSEATLLDLVEAYEQAHPFPHPAGYQAFWP